VPVIFGWDGNCIYVYTTEGKKVDMMRENQRVCFEIDGTSRVARGAAS